MSVDESGSGIRGRRPSNRGAAYSYVRQGTEVLAAWPRSRGRKLHPKTKAQMEFFRQVQKAFKYSDAAIQVTYAQAVHGTPLMPRDLFLMAAACRMHSVIDTNGKVWWGVPAIKNVSASLDVLNQLPGSFLLRGTDLWEGVPITGIGAYLSLTAADISGLGYFATGTDAANLTGVVSVGQGGTGEIAPSGAAVDAISGFAATGQLVRTATGTYAFRALVAPASGITVTHGDGIAGDPTLALSDDLAALEGLAGTGFGVRTGASAWLLRALTAGANITVTNGDGVAGAPLIALTKTLDVGAYTPTVTGVANIATSSANPSFYVRVGDYVIVFASFTATTTTINTDTQIRVSLPVASNITAISDLIGVVAGNTSSATSKPFGTAVTAPVAHEALCRFLTPTNGSINYYTVFGYKVI